jgi:hypothetical protein
VVADLVLIAVVVLITGGRSVRLRTVSSTALLSIRLALGIALIVIAAVQWRQRNRPRRAPAWLAGARLRRHDWMVCRDARRGLLDSHSWCLPV